MTINRPLLAACLLAALTLVSCLAGVLLGHQLGRSTVVRGTGHAYWNERAIADIDHRVHLAPAQRERLQALLDQAVGELRGVRGEALGRAAAIITRLLDQAEAELTPEQRAGFQAIRPKARDMVSLELLEVDRTR